jgi:hypothetical protein
MAVATYYADTILNQPRAIHGGVNAVTGIASTGAVKSTIGDIMVLAKVPDGAMIIDVIVEHVSGSTTQVFDYGLGYPASLASGLPSTLTQTGSNASQFATGVAQSTITRSTVPTQALNNVVSCSASTADNLKYACVFATNVSGTTTTSVQVKATVMYYIPPR